MRFMLLLYETDPPAHGPAAHSAGRRTTYDRALRTAGVLLAQDRLHPAALGARISCSCGERRVVQGRPDESKETVTRYWILEVRSRDEALEWAVRCPLGDHEILEVRELDAATEVPRT